jgi:hypothetical protein
VQARPFSCIASPAALSGHEILRRANNGLTYLRNLSNSAAVRRSQTQRFALSLRGVPNLQHHGGQQRILDLLNLEDTPYNASCAFAIERSRGACSRRAYPLYSHSTPPRATIVESVHPDSRHHALRDRCSCSIGVISLFNGLSDACLHRSVAGSGNLFRSHPPDRQVRVGSPLR